MKKSFSIFLTLLLCFCMVASLPAVRALPVTEFAIPFSQEALLSALYEADIATLRQAIDLRLITCEELTAYYLDRISAYNDPYNCFITLCDNALEVARQRDAQLARGDGEGLLFGIPVVVKDNIHYEGYYTTNGLHFETSEISDHNAYVVERLLEEGAVIIAKSNMSEAASSARESTSWTVGETKNAYNSYFVSGGSSGGSAVATSLNFAVAGLGTDTNASLRTPAVLNGCVSMRATFGLIPLDGIIVLNGFRDVPGTITRTVLDQAIMMDVLTYSAYDYTKKLNADALDGLRLGIIQELLNEDHPDTDPDILDAFYDAVAELEACGAEVVTISFPDLIELSDATYEENNQESMDALYSRFSDLLAHHELDAMLYPSYTSKPIRSGYDEDGVFWDPYEQEHLTNSFALPSCAQVPAIALPTGNHALGSGLGIEIVADKHSEQLLLDIAYSYTLQYPHRALPEGAPDAYADAHAGNLQTLITAYLQAEAAANATIPPTEPTAPPTEPTIPPTEPTAPPTEPTVPPTESTSPPPTLPSPTEPESPSPIPLELTGIDLLFLSLGGSLGIILLILLLSWLFQGNKRGKYSAKKKNKGKYLPRR